MLDKILERFSGVAIVVEGKRDKKSLEALGLDNVYVMNEFGGVDELASILAENHHTSVVILTDFDDEGEKLRKKILMHLQSWGIREDSSLRSYFKNVFGVIEIEDSYTAFIKYYGGDANGKDLRRFSKIYNKGKIRGKRTRGKTGCNRSYFWSNRGAPRDRT